ncbi:hypothetical protein K435DRAFT_691249 [Dendrothele bispora CBS 962.96]|uniref:VWFA domain-containing protein n=1 Tax=Dendrothele bispora (strain CBS 962.96) TaxID=1314807 RepID=A0A4S8L1V1_DENBC|nr:hypothetical protein K435DRAFT_691722 [Dendrothele bispora CBS 962.96]THU82567.1 hypothetical protein K435DRAFT_691249 [Dendrothele bispora CBS 962.96]
MAGRLWCQARDALAAVAEASPQFDADGVDMYFLNSERRQKNIRTRNEVVRLFNEVLPDGATPTGRRLQQVLDEYIPRVEQRMTPVKPINIIVITDGDPTDNVESVIVNAAQRLHRSQVPDRILGIQFVQIGDDPKATQALRELDSSLEHRYQIRVSSAPCLVKQFEDTIVKVLWGAIDKHVDRRDELPQLQGLRIN